MSLDIVYGYLLLKQDNGKYTILDKDGDEMKSNIPNRKEAALMARDLYDANPAPQTPAAGSQHDLRATLDAHKRHNAELDAWLDDDEDGPWGYDFSDNAPDAAAASAAGDAPDAGAAGDAIDPHSDLGLIIGDNEWHKEQLRIACDQRDAAVERAERAEGERDEWKRQAEAENVIATGYFDELAILRERDKALDFLLGKLSYLKTWNAVAMKIAVGEDDEDLVILAGDTDMATLIGKMITERTARAAAQDGGQHGR